jgi:serine/threonine protein kinase/tetratricopeptide (TPR) repeat protein
MNECIPEDQLRAFAESKLNPDDNARIDTHLSACTRCQESMDRITRPVVLESPVLGSNPLSADTAPEVPGYRFVERLGKGGMGVVWLAEQTTLKRLVAVKTIRLKFGADTDELARRFQIEAEAVARLAHPNIVRIFDTGRGLHGPYFTMEYIQGGSLDAQLDGVPWAPAKAGRLVADLASAMQHAHDAGILHRDLKPANILIEVNRADTTKTTAKISDFGLAKLLDREAAETEMGRAIGSPSYMAPEQAEGRPRDISPLTDVYALGAVLYELLTGRPPFRGASNLETAQLVRSSDVVPPRQLVPAIPRDLEIICLRALEKAPQDRFASARDFADDLERFLDHKPIVSKPPSLARRVSLAYRRSPGRFWIAGLLAACSLLALAWGFTAWGDWNRRQAALGETLHVLEERQKEGLPWEGPLERAEALVQAGAVPGDLAREVLRLRVLADDRAKDAKLRARLDELTVQLTGIDAPIEDVSTVQLKGNESPINGVKTAKPGIRKIDTGKINEHAKAAFLARGVPLADVAPDELAQVFTDPRTRLDVALFLTRLAYGRRVEALGEANPLNRYFALADALDSDPSRTRFRAIFAAVKINEKDLRDLIASFDFETQPALMGNMLGQAASRFIDGKSGHEVFAKVFARYPGDFTTLYYLDSNHSQHANPGKITSRYRMAMAALRPDSRDTIGRLATGLIAEKDLVLAQAMLERTVRLKPADAVSWERLGHLHIQRKDHKQALLAYEKAVEQNPQRAPAWRNLAQLHAGFKDHAKAIQANSKAIELEPDHLESRMRLAWDLANQPAATVENGRQALKVLEPVAQSLLWKDRPEYLEAAAAAHAVLGDFKIALELQEKAAADEAFRKRSEPGITARLAAYRENRRWPMPNPRQDNAKP